jgi:hypothetical protein
MIKVEGREEDIENTSFDGKRKNDSLDFDDMERLAA